MTKTRTDAFESGLSEADRAAIFEKARTLPWFEVTAWIHETHGLVVSRSAFYRFLARQRDTEAAQRLSRAVASTKEVGALAEKSGLTDAPLIAAIKTIAADALLSSDDAKTAQRLVAMATSLQRSSHDLEKLRLDRDKFEAAEKRLAAVGSAVSDETLSDADRVRKIKTLFGIA